MMAASLKMAILLPDAAMRPSRPADPFSCEDMDENVSDCCALDALACARARERERLVSRMKKEDRKFSRRVYILSHITSHLSICREDGRGGRGKGKGERGKGKGEGEKSITSIPCGRSRPGPARCRRCPP